MKIIPTLDDFLQKQIPKPMFYGNVEIKLKEITLFTLTLTNVATLEIGASSQKLKTEATRNNFYASLELQLGFQNSFSPNENHSIHSLHATSRITC